MSTRNDSWRGGGTGRGAYTLVAQTAAQVPLTIQTAAGQTANALLIENSAGTDLLTLDASGNLTIAGTATVAVNEAITGNITLTGTLTVAGATTLNGAVTLGDAATDAITVRGAPTFQYNVVMWGDLQINNILSVQNSVYLYERTGNPTSISNQGALYTREIAAVTELFYLDSSGNAVQMTSGGAVGGGAYFTIDDTYYSMGNTAATPDARLGWNTTQTVDGVYFGLSDAQNTFVIAENGDRAFDFAHGAATNPTVFIHSAVQSTTQYVSISHNQTDAVILSGAGAVVVNATAFLPDADDAYALGASGTSFSDLFLAAGGVINWGAGDVTLTEAANALTLAGATDVTVTQAAATTGAAVITFTGGAHTGITAATEDAGVNFNFSATKTWALGAGPLALQREILIQAPTYVGDVGGALTITEAATVAITGAPTQGANMTLSETHALLVMAGSSAFGGNVQPRATDGAALGTTAIMWSDLFLASGAVVNFDNGDVTITHTANTLAFAGASSGYTFDAEAIITRAGVGFDVTNSTDGASVQVAILQGNRATITDGDEAYVTLELSDSAGNQDEGARITWKATTVAAGATQDTDLIFSALVNNVLTTMLTLDGSASELVPAVAINSAAAITGTAITGTSFVIGANTLTTTEWAFLDGQNQSVFTTSSPTFVNLTITSFAANWTNAGRTVADLGIVTTVDINGGTLDGVTIGATTAAAATVTTLTGSTAGNVLTITNSSDAASVQVGIIQGDRATIADGDEAYLTLSLSDSAGTQDEGARITWKATTVLSGATQDTDLILSALVNNVLTTFLTLDGSASVITLAQPLDLDSTFDIDSGTGANALDSTATTSDAFTFTASSLTTGDGFRVVSNSADINARNLVEILQDNAAATATTALSIQQDGDERALYVAQNGNDTCYEATTAATTFYAIDIGGNSLTTGGLAYLYSNSADTSARNLVNIINDNTLATGAIPLRLQQDAAADSLQVFDGATQIFTISDGGIVYINDTANTGMTTGLTINQGAADDQIFAFKSSDVAHGVTTLAETDTYALWQKVGGDGGGLACIALQDANAANAITLQLEAVAGVAANTTKTTGGFGVINLNVSLANGTGTQAIGADGNLLSLRNNGTTRFIFDAEGSAHADVEWIAFDTHDDVALLDTLDAKMNKRDAVTNAFGEVLKYNQDDLQEAGIVNFYDDGPRAMVNTTRLAMLHTGAIRQLYKKIEEQALKITQLEQRLLTA